MTYANDITFIIPCFNPNIDALKKCLDSLLCQISPDDEVILINDGSKNTKKIQQLAKTLPIKFITLPKNQGVSNARNVGIEKATKNWVTFIDSDDFILPNTLPKIKSKLQKTKDTDVLVCAILANKLKGHQEFPLLNAGETTKDLRKEIISLRTSSSHKPRTIGITQGKFYKKDFLTKHHLRFVPNISRAEDHIFFLDVLSHNPQLKSFPLAFYEISYNPASATKKYTKNLFSVFEKTLSELSKRIDLTDPEEIIALKARRGNYILISINNEFRIENPASFSQKIHHLRHLLKNPENYSSLKTYHKEVKSQSMKLISSAILLRQYLLVGIVLSLRNTRKYHYEQKISKN